MLAASTASALPSSSTSAMCSSLPAPPLATTGTPTASLIRRVMTRSNPSFVPSASMLLRTISPAPSDTCPLGPIDRFPARRLAAAVREDLPPVRRHLPGVNGHHDALAAELLSPGADQIRVGQRRRV